MARKLDDCGKSIPFIQRVPKKYTPPKFTPLSLSIKPTVVMYYCDAHDRIDLDKERFKWLGKYARDHKPDMIVNGGDTFDVDSLNSHVGDDTVEGRLKPDFEMELVSLNCALQEFDEYCPKDIPKFITLGNHEQRVYGYENSHPSVGTIMSGEMEAVFDYYGYQITPYRSVLEIDGVWFTHCPHNGMRKPIGGVNGTATVAKSSPRSIIYGHTHRREEYVFAQAGYDNAPNNSVRAYNGGCFLPHGVKFHYARASQSAWDYGFSMITIADGKITDVEWITLEKLQRMYHVE